MFQNVINYIHSYFLLVHVLPHMGHHQAASSEETYSTVHLSPVPVATLFLLLIFFVGYFQPVFLTAIVYYIYIYV
jgi:hypothetical protein